MRDRINQSVKDAMKSRDKLRLSTLRLMQAAIKDRDIAARVDPKGQSTGKERIEETEILALLQKMIKQRRESAETYKQGGRLDLVDKENAEIEIISEFMPKQMDDAEMEAAIAKVMEDIGFCGLKDMGKTMGQLKALYSGQMDFGKASAMIKSKC